jgi:hypothetical protein
VPATEVAVLLVSLTRSGIWRAVAERFSGVSAEKERLDTAIDALASLPEFADKPELDDVRTSSVRIETRLTALALQLQESERRASRSGRRLFVLGTVLGLPVGILGTWVATVLGLGS